MSKATAPKGTAPKAEPKKDVSPELQAKLDKAAAEKREANRKEREESFKKIAVRRTNQAIKIIGSLSNLTNKSNYDFTPEQVEKMFDLIETVTKETRAKFAVVVKEKTVVSLSL